MQTRSNVLAKLFFAAIAFLIASGSFAGETLSDIARLDNAFVELSKQGILTMHNSGYTQQDLFSDVSDRFHYEVNKLNIKGWCGYHEQDVEQSKRDKEMHLAFGDINGDLKSARLIGNEIVKELRRAGLNVKWSGKTGDRILLKPFAWSPLAAHARKYKSPSPSLYADPKSGR